MAQLHALVLIDHMFKTFEESNECCTTPFLFCQNDVARYEYVVRIVSLLIAEQTYV